MTSMSKIKDDTIVAAATAGDEQPFGLPPAL
jgi:hypothetical protein